MAIQTFKSYLLLPGGVARAQAFAAANRDVFLLPFFQPRLIVYDRSLDCWAPREALKQFEVWQDAFHRFFSLLQDQNMRLQYVEPRFSPDASDHVQSSILLSIAAFARKGDTKGLIDFLRLHRSYFDIEAVEFPLLGMNVRLDAFGRITMRGHRILAQEALETPEMQTLLGLSA